MEPTEATTTTTNACETTSSEPVNPHPAQLADGDLTVAAVLAVVEVLAVGAYTTARDAGAAGRFGNVPPAVARYVDTALGHHQAALDAWNRMLVGAGRPPVMSAPVVLTISINEQFGSVADGAGAARVAFSLERLAAATYLKAFEDLASALAIGLAGSILSIERQHMCVLLFALGQYPVPETFATSELAYVP